MLTAILSSKAGRVSDEITPETSWRDIFKQSEDLLTAAVFTRLSYLPGDMFWRVLTETFGGPLGKYKIAKLDSIEFWPSWSRADGTRVEPDVFVSFLAGDPPRRVDLIIEAKLRRDDTKQSETQWANQWLAYSETMSAERELNDSNADELYLLAIGGLGPNRCAKLAELSKKAASEERAKDFQALGAGWDDLAKKLKQLVHGSASERRICRGALDALALAGYRPVHLLETLGPMGGAWNPDSAARAIEKYFGSEQ